MNNAEVMSSISLDANEVLVVYSRDRSTSQVVRKIQYGPMLFTPSADEWWVWLRWCSVQSFVLFAGCMSLFGMELIDRTKLRRYLVDYDLQNSVSSQINSTTM